MAVNNSLNTPYVIGGNSSGYPTNHGILTGQGTKEVKSTVLTNGQLMIGSTGNDPIAASLTAGSNITITPGSGTITIAASGAGSNILAVQTFTTSGTYTPTSGMAYCIIECWGGGGAGGTAGGTNVLYVTSAGGGGAGGYSRKLSNAAAIGVSKAVTIGAGGAYSNDPAANGDAGGNTSVGSICIAIGGGGGSSTSGGNETGGAGTTIGGFAGGGSAGTGDITGVGDNGMGGYIGGQSSTLVGMGGAGGSTSVGSGGVGGQGFGYGANGGNGRGYGAGGGGATVAQAVENATGGNGTSGLVIITEYII